MSKLDQHTDGMALDDAALDRLVNAALADERMPEGLAASTLAFIHAKAAACEPAPSGSVPATCATSAETAPACAVPAPQQTAPSPTAPSPRLVADNVVPLPARGTRRRAPRKRFAQLLAACLVAGALTAGGVAYATETAQVQLDGGATVELGLNCWGRVVRVASSDEALARIVDDLGVAGMTCSDALETLSASDELQGALTSGGPVLIVAASGNAGQLDATMGDCQAAASGFGPGAMCASLDGETRAAAQASGMGMARYHMYEQIAAIDPSITVEDCQGLSMRELRSLLAATERAAAEDTDSVGDGQDGTDGIPSDAADEAPERDGAGPGHGAGQGMGAGNGQGHGTGGGNGHGGGNGQGHGKGGQGMGGGRMHQGA